MEHVGRRVGRRARESVGRDSSAVRFSDLSSTTGSLTCIHSPCRHFMSVSLCRLGLTWTKFALLKPGVTRHGPRTSLVNYERLRAYSQPAKPQTTSKEEQALASAIRENLISIRKSIADVDSTADWESMKDQITRLQAGLSVRNTLLLVSFDTH